MDKKQEKYEAILKSAVKLFAQKGFNNTKIKDITDNASLAAGTFYLYFKHKSDLLDAIIGKYINEILDNLEQISKSDGDSIEKIQKYISMHIGYFYRNQEFIQVYFENIRFNESFDPFECHKKYSLRYFDYLEKLLIQGQIENAISEKVNIKVASRSILGMIVFSLLKLLIIEKNQKISQEEITENISNIFIKGIEKC